jgi:uncharacterized metal-binding protein YceD (DUF177 family)
LSSLPPSIDVDRFTRQKQTVEGAIRPTDLPRLAPYLAAVDGEIRYRLSGSVAGDAAVGQKKRVKCIIYGWFFLADPVSLEPLRVDVDIESVLVLVPSEADLPPMEAEKEGEDTIVCGPKMDIAGQIEEEILLELPANLLTGDGQNEETPGLVAKPGSTGQGDRGPDARTLPFAKLAELKKK